MLVNKGVSKYKNVSDCRIIELFSSGIRTKEIVLYFDIPLIKY